MSQKATIPVGVELLGRVINSSGTPLDSQGTITAQQAPVVELSALAGRQQPERAPQMLETRIKLIDLLAPIPRGGAIAFFGGAGLGKQVVTQEVMQHFMTHHNGYAVLVDVSEDTYETTGLAEIINEPGRREKSVFVYEQQQATPQLCRQALQAALTIGEHFRKQRHEVLLIAEDYVVKQAGSSDLQRSAQALGITTLLLGPVEENIQQEANIALNGLDGRLVFSRDLARQNLWPAIDRLLSTSRLLESNAVGAEHKQIAEQVRQLLRRVQDLQGTQNLSPDDEQAVKRAARIQQFLTQPFFVAEPYTEVPGEYVRLADTLSGFKALLEGRYDDLPEQAFAFVGTIEQALAKASKK
jgi:F-type H+-transporting ATPase subunit beta